MYRVKRKGGQFRQQSSIPAALGPFPARSGSRLTSSSSEQSSAENFITTRRGSPHVLSLLVKCSVVTYVNVFFCY